MDSVLDLHLQKSVPTKGLATKEADLEAKTENLALIATSFVILFPQSFAQGISY